jgi:hypothetical protein
MKTTIIFSSFFILTLIIVVYFIYFIVNYNSPTLYELSSDELKWLFKNKKAKYLSKNNIDRHYIITYNDDNTFTTDGYINNIKSGRSYGTYSIEPNGTCNVFYEHVSPSVNRNSIFNPNNKYYSSLTNYTIGQFYLIDKTNIYDYNDDSSATNVYYKCKHCNNMLTFYPK